VLPAPGCPAGGVAAVLARAHAKPRARMWSARLLRLQMVARDTAPTTATRNYRSLCSARLEEPEPTTIRADDKRRLARPRRRLIATSTLCCACAKRDAARRKSVERGSPDPRPCGARPRAAARCRAPRTMKRRSGALRAPAGLETRAPPESLRGGARSDGPTAPATAVVHWQMNVLVLKMSPRVESKKPR